MPDMGGSALAKRLRKRHASLPILCIPGYAEQAVIHDGIVKTEEQFLQEPFSPFELAEKVRNVLDPKTAPKRSGSSKRDFVYVLPKFRGPFLRFF